MAWYNNPITHGYITGYQGPGTDTPHYAIDIGAPFHTPFSFPVSGTIAQADYAMWSGQPGGGEVFLKPDNGGEEQYVYHLDEIDVHSGQHVSAGTQVGLSGGENPGYPGAQHPASPMWSSGPHIHYGFFDSYKNTPAGGRPYGSDPTAYYQSLSKNGISGSAGTGLTDLFNPSGSSSSASTGLGVLGLSMPTQDQMIRGALVLGGVVLIIMGLHSLLQKSQGDTSALQAATQSDAQTAQKQAAATEKQNQQSSQKYMRRFGRGTAPPPPSEQKAASKFKEAAEVAAVA